MLNQIINGDCFEIMCSIPANSIDLIIFDPPYNIGSDSKITMIGGKPFTTNVAWGNEGFNDTFSNEDYEKLMVKSTEEFSRVLSDEGSIVIFYDRGYGEYLLPFKKKFVFRNTIDFIKTNPIPHWRKNNYRSGFESAMWFSRDKYHINFLGQDEMVNIFKGPIGANKETEHPTEKYKWMIKPIIERHSKKGDTILDPMCGSGTTCVVAKELGRKYIGIELDKNYYEIAYKRVNNTIEFPAEDLDETFK